MDAHHGRVEYYNTETKRLDVPDWDYNPGETALSQVPRMFRQPEALRRVLATATQYHTLDVGSRAPIKLPQPVKPADLPGANGEALLPFLYSLRESDRPRFDAVTDALRAAYPDFEELTFPPAAAGMLALSWKDKKFESPIYADELSEGTLRFLWLTALLQSPELSTVTMIDEPEVSLHPELLDLLAQLMREASARTQLIVTTHSDRFVRFLKPDEVYVMDVGEEGEATITPADTLDLARWLDEYSLDEVWRMGRMGGRA
ncbi:AAA family ATPase [Fretibacterium fastidiosum]|uniref:AAA family ATPase n=1 Tax=Fretibacterium fastidiosum TaxID=651822 RepID=UPI003C6F1BA5